MANDNSSEPTAQPQGSAQQTPVPSETKSEIKSELPVVDSPSISPARPEAEVTAAVEPKIEPTIESTVEPVAVAPVVEPAPAIEAPASEDAPQTATRLFAFSRFALNDNHRHYALLAASVTLAVALGAVLGAGVVGGSGKPPQTHVAAVDETKAMQQSIARLSREVTTLKANIEASNKAAHTQIAKMSEKFSERLKQERAEITGSISAPQTVAAAPSPSAPVAVPVPTPRPAPAPRIAAVETQPPPRSTVVQGWSIHDTRGGYVYVESHGEIYQVMPGVPLPGLGVVASVKRLDGRWVVATPRGIIVSMRDRSYFE